MKTRNTNIILLISTIIIIFASCRRELAVYDASGTFEADEIIVSSEGNGKIITFNVEEGMQIDSGQVLGFVDTTQLYLKKLQSGSSITAVKSRKADVNKQIAALQQQISTLQNEKIRIENLLKADVATSKQLDDINAQIATLEKQLAAQTSSLENANSSISAESSGLEIQIAQLEDQIKKCYISSPISGTVLVKYAERGELATAGRALFKIADVSNMTLRVYVTASQLTQLKIGQQVSVFADFGEKNAREYHGTISWISEKSEFTPKTIQTRNERANLVYAVKIKVKNDGYLKIGMYGGVNFTPKLP